MSSSQEIVCKQCGTTNYGVLYNCLKCGAALGDRPDHAATIVDIPENRFEAPTIVDHFPDQGAYIEITEGPDQGNHYALKNGITFGRSKKCDIVIDSPKVSREHAKITQNEYLQWLIVDLDSMNGTILNNRRITRPAVLYNGDKFQISDLIFKVTIKKTYLTDTPQTSEDQAEAPKDRGLAPLAERKGFLSNTGLIVTFSVILLVCICAVLYFGWDILSDLDLFQFLR